MNIPDDAICEQYRDSDGRLDFLCRHGRCMPGTYFNRGTFRTTAGDQKTHKAEEYT